MFLVNPHRLNAPVGGDLLADGFNDSSFNTGLWARRNNTPSISLTEDTQRVELLNDATTGTSESIDSIASYNCVGRTMDWRMDGVSGYFAGGNAYGYWYTAGLGYVGIYTGGFSGFTWGFSSQGGWTSTSLGSTFTFGDTYFRMVHNAATDVCTFFMSADGITYRNVGSLSSIHTDLNISASKATLQYNPGTANTPAWFNAFRLY